MTRAILTPARRQRQAGARRDTSASLPRHRLFGVPRMTCSRRAVAPGDCGFDRLCSPAGDPRPSRPADASPGPARYAPEAAPRITRGHPRSLRPSTSSAWRALLPSGGLVRALRSARRAIRRLLERSHRHQKWRGDPDLRTAGNISSGIVSHWRCRSHTSPDASRTTAASAFRYPPATRSPPGSGRLSRNSGSGSWRGRGSRAPAPAAERLARRLSSRYRLARQTSAPTRRRLKTAGRDLPRRTWQRRVMAETILPRLESSPSAL